MLYVICGLVFVGSIAVSFFFGWIAHTCYTFDKLSEVIEVGREDLAGTPVDEADEILTFYKGYIYALKLAGVKLGASIDNMKRGI